MTKHIGTKTLLAVAMTQTRRVVKAVAPADATSAGVFSAPGKAYDGEWNWLSGDPRDIDSWGWVGEPFRCPYGQPGDRLWVKETWRTAKSLDSKSPATIAEMCIDAGYRKPWAPLAYEADGHRNSEWRRFEMVGDAEPGKTRASIHMPRWASRITLEITAVRVERLQDISEADAQAEGCPIECMTPTGDDSGSSIYGPGGYMALWNDINGPRSWDANPWVWVVEFKRITQ